MLLTVLQWFLVFMKLFFVEIYHLLHVSLGLLMKNSITEIIKYVKNLF